MRVATVTDMTLGKTALLAIGGGGLSGLAAVAALGGSPLGVLLAWIAAAPLLIVGLSLGVGAFGFAAAAGLVVATVSGGFAAAGLYGGMHVVPSWLIVQQALRHRAASADGWMPAGDVLATLTLLIAFVVAVTSLSAAGEDGLEASVRALLAEVFEAAGTGLDESERAQVVDQLAPLFLGFSAASWLIMIAVNAVFAQNMLASRNRNLRPTPAWSALRLPDWFDFLLVGCAAAALLTGGDTSFVLRNLVVVLLTPYFFVGMATVHSLAGRTHSRALALTTFYLLLLVFFVFAAAAVALLGVAEQWFGVRRRRAAPPPDDGSE